MNVTIVNSELAARNTKIKIEITLAALEMWYNLRQRIIFKA